MTFLIDCQKLLSKWFDGRYLDLSVLGDLFRGSCISNRQLGKVRAKQEEHDRDDDHVNKLKLFT